jgi:hypothetical protein
LNEEFILNLENPPRVNPQPGLISTDAARLVELKRAGVTESVITAVVKKSPPGEPICASCRKIRNEAGTWETLEMYFRNHSHVEFTHGICQECTARFDI